MTMLVVSQESNTQCIYIQNTNELDETTDPRQYSGPQQKCLKLERVSSPEALAQGLSGRQSLGEDQGMLFIFEQPGEHCFWMKEMNFPLDIIWLNENKQVITIKENVHPDTYPERFCPNKLAKYVIEVNAGIADRALISEGSQLQF